MSDVDFECNVVEREFDATFYSADYPELKLGTDLIRHFCEIGWFEGRNPTPFFDTVSYLDTYPDVARAAINPFFHFLFHGRNEGREPSPSMRPGVRTKLIFGYAVPDWVDRIRPTFDEAYYKSQLREASPHGVDWAAHFAFRGWRHGFSPNRQFSVPRWLERYPQFKSLGVNPLIIDLEIAAGRFSVARSDPVGKPGNPVTPSVTMPVVKADIRETTLPHSALSGATGADVIAPEFSASYYLAQYPDVAAAGVDPLEHYCMAGWREGRNPNRTFESTYYLKSNVDVAEAGLNPFWHFIAAGRSEGRLPRRPGGYRRRVIDAASDPLDRRHPPEDPKGQVLDPGELTKLMQLAFAKGRPVISLSHDCYIRSVGGTQILITDEQEKFNSEGRSYIHLSPFTPCLYIRSDDDALTFTVVVDGRLVGVASAAAMYRVFGALSGAPSQALLVVHSLLGFSMKSVLNLSYALVPNRQIYWVHDYSSICPGYNLLRNDVAYCAAPPPHSLACRVCVYGNERSKQHNSVRALFEKIPFEVLAPSAAALRIWREGAGLSCESSGVHNHWQLIARDVVTDEYESAVRVAFVGYPAVHKGWPLFEELHALISDNASFELYHFATEGSATLANIEFVPTRVTGTSRMQAVERIVEHKIDIVAMFSPWPETFSFVTYEAIAAGARIVCLEDSGNVAAVVRQTGQGVVFPDAASLLAHFESLAAIEDALLWRKHRQHYDIEQSGSTATWPKFAQEVCLG